MSDHDQKESFGKYRILDLLAEGPVARVCRAADEEANRRVILRIVDPLVCRNEQLRADLEGMCDPNSDRRIQDPAVLRILDVGKVGESYYIAYEDFDGRPVGEFLQEGRPSLREALTLARLMAESLRAVHGHKLVHGDIKPQNILVGRTPHGREIVKIALADLAHTSTDAMISIYGGILGTPKYLSPEQIMGKRPTAASDIFSLGIIFYELFSAREPFPADGPAGYLHANAAREAQPLCVLDSTVPVDVSKIVMRMLARDPRSRYRNIQSVLDDLERVEAQLDGVMPETVPPGADSAFAQAAGEWYTAGRGGAWRLTAMIALAASLVLLGAVVLLLVRPADTGPETAARTEPSQEGTATSAPTETTTPLEEEKPARTELSDEETYFAERHRLAMQFIDHGNFDKALETLNELHARFQDARHRRTLRQDIAFALSRKADTSLRADLEDEALGIYQMLMRQYSDTRYAGEAATKGAQIIMKRAERHESRGELKDAIEQLELIVKDAPRTPDARKAREKLPDLRIKRAERLLTLNPDISIALLQDAMKTSLSEQQSANAQRILARAFLTRATQHLQNKRYEECLQDLDAARKTHESVNEKVKLKETRALYEYALALKAQQKPAQAVKTARELITRYPKSPLAMQAKSQLGTLLAATGGTAAPADDASLEMRLAEAALKNNDLAAARPRLETILRQYPDSPHAARAARLLAPWDLEAALKLLERGRQDEAGTQLENITKKFGNTDAARRAERELALLRNTPEGMVYVPAGEFIMGLAKETVSTIMETYTPPKGMVLRWFGPQHPAHIVTVDAYYIDRHEVTNAEYKEFVDATGAAPPPSPAWEGKDVKPAYEDHPVTCVAWRDAVEYATWAGKRLPTEAEWEKAARGRDGRLFPWDGKFDATRCVIGTGGTRPAGSLPNGRSPYGCDDMIGNVAEWTQDDYTPYSADVPKTLVFDAQQKVVRGSGFQDLQPYFSFCTRRQPLAPQAHSPSLGFRCVKDVKKHIPGDDAEDMRPAKQRP